MVGFLGEYEATLDSKGRFLLPVGFKKQMTEEGTTQFVVNRGFEKCLSLYPMKSWEPIFARISQLNDFDPEVRQFSRYFLNGATMADLAIAIVAGFNWLNHCATLVEVNRERFSGTLRTFRKIAVLAQQWWATEGADARCSQMLDGRQTPPLMLYLVWL